LNFDGAHRLIKAGNLLSLRQALDRGVNPNLSNKYGWTLLMVAALAGDSKIGQLLISRGGDLDRINRFGETALSLAAHKGHVPFVKILLAKGARKKCRPHGRSLEDWLKNASGLPLDKITSLLKLIEG
jgi:ankyrin repeat protein